MRGNGTGGKEAQPRISRNNSKARGSNPKGTLWRKGFLSKGANPSDALPSHGVKPTWGFHKVKLWKVETWRHVPGF
jgi:hypothetical protein